MQLVIAEKPDLGKAIAAAIPGASSYDGKAQIITKTFHGKPITICWCFGHLLTLLDPEDYDEKYKEWKMEDLPFFFENWGRKIKGEGTKGGASIKARVEQIGKLLKSCDSVIHAGDIDDEGQLLIDELLDWHHYKGPVYRLNTNDTSEAALFKALENMEDNAKFRSNGVAAYGRQICDMTFGYNLSRYYSIINDKNLPVGRVKMPTLGLVVQRDRLIEGHKKSFYYVIDVLIDVDGKSVPGKFVPDAEDSNLVDGKIINKSYVEKIATDLRGVKLNPITVSKRTVLESPPLPFNQTKLYSYCESKYGLSPKVVSEITQTLRDKYKAITYNRSDCQYLGTATFEEAPDTLPLVCKNLGVDTKQFDTSIKSKCFNDANITAHTAIIPTQTEQDLSKFTKDERTVYEAIAKFYLIQFMPPCEKSLTKLTSNVPLSCKGTVEATSTVIIKPGYLAFFKDMEPPADEDDADDADKSSGETPLSSIAPGDYSGKVASAETKEKETRPPARYTRSSLIKDMTSIAKYCENKAVKKLLLQKDEGKKGENGSIGTPATREIIIEDLIRIQYFRVEKKGKKEYLISTAMGREFYDVLPDSVRKVDVSAKWWYEQEQIKEGKMTPDQMARDVLKTISVIVSSGEGRMEHAAAYARNASSAEPIGKCPKCGADVIETPKGFKCSSKDCNFIIFKDNKFFSALGKNITSRVASSLLSKGKVTLKNCTSKKGNKYDATILCDFSGQYPAFSFEPFKPKTSKK